MRNGSLYAVAVILHSSRRRRRQSPVCGGLVVWGRSVMSAWWCASGHWFGASSSSSSMAHAIAVAMARWIDGECVVVCIWSLIWGGSVVRTRSGVGHWFGGKEKTLWKEKKENFNLTGQPFITHGLRARLAGLERATGWKIWPHPFL